MVLPPFRLGGLPIVDEDGVLVGAIGVSGSSVENDHKVALAGVEVLAERVAGPPLPPLKVAIEHCQEPGLRAISLLDFAVRRGTPHARPYGAAFGPSLFESFGG
jgi:hypothetical protein